MSQWNDKAWNILTEEEKFAITLTVVQNLSTLKAGEIMGKSHYKFLEIKDRARVFLKIFTEYLATHSTPVPHYMDASGEFKEYIRLVIVRRIPLKEAYTQMSNPFWMYKGYREKHIVDNMKKLYRSKKIYNQDLFELIKEFDRWNNYRILPYSVQDPSAFKRRNKNAHIKVMRHLYKMNPYSVKKIIERYMFKTNKKSRTRLGYFVVFSKELKNPIIPCRISIKRVEKIAKELGKIGIYIYPTEELAVEFYNMVKAYMEEGKDCKYGQKFWPKYRLLLKESVNYDYILKVIPHRKYFAEALKDMDSQLIKEK